MKNGIETCIKWWKNLICLAMVSQIVGCINAVSLKQINQNHLPLEDTQLLQLNS